MKKEIEVKIDTVMAIEFARALQGLKVMFSPSKVVTNGNGSKTMFWKVSGTESQIKQVLELERTVNC